MYVRSTSETTTKQNPKLSPVSSLHLLIWVLSFFPVHRIQYFCDKEGCWSYDLKEVFTYKQLWHLRKGLSLGREVWEKPDKAASGRKKQVQLDENL